MLIVRQITSLAALSALCALLLTACASTTSLKSVAVDMTVVPSTSFAFSDERPAAERISSVTNRSYGATIMLADDVITPPLPELFKATLERRLSNPLKGRQVTLSEFDVAVLLYGSNVDMGRLNVAASSVPNASPLGALLALPLIATIEAVRTEKTVSIRIRGTLDGKPFESSHAQYFRGRVNEDDVRIALTAGLARAADDVAAVAATPAPAGSPAAILLDDIAAKLKQARALPAGSPPPYPCPENLETLTGLPITAVVATLGTPPFVALSKDSYTYFLSAPLRPGQRGGGAPQITLETDNADVIRKAGCTYAR